MSFHGDNKERILRPVIPIHSSMRKRKQKLRQQENRIVWSDKKSNTFAYGLCCVIIFLGTIAVWHLLKDIPVGGM